MAVLPYRITGLAWVFMLLIKYGLSDENIILRIEGFNSTRVNATCQYLGDPAENKYIDISINGTKCLTYSIDHFQEHPSSEYNCQTGFSDDMRIGFSFDPPKTCNKSFEVACNINNGEVIPAYISIDAKHDSPEICINGGQEVNRTDKPVPVECVIKNMCKKEEIEIISNAGAYIGPLSVNFEDSGERFIAKANTTALFYGKEKQFDVTCRTRSGRISHSVQGLLNYDSDHRGHDRSNSGQLIGEKKSENFKVAFIVTLVMSIVIFAGLAIYIYKLRRK